MINRAIGRTPGGVVGFTGDGGVRPAKRGSRLRRIGGLAAFVGAAGILLAPPARALTLLDCYRAALEHDSVLASAEAAHRGGTEIVQQAKSQLGPQVQATAAVSEVKSKPVLGYAGANGNTESAGLTLTQPLYHRADWVAWNQADYQVLGLDAQLTGARQNLFLRTAQAYFNALLAQDSLEFTRTERQSIALQVAQAKRSFQVGTVAITDVTDSQARYDLSAANELQYQSDLEVARQALQQLTGIPADNLAGVPTGAAPGLPQPDDIQYWTSAAEAKNPAVQQAAATLNVQQLEIKHAGAATWPTLDLVAGVSTERFSTPDLYLASTSGGRQATVGLQLNWLIWDAGMRNSRVRQAVAGADAARDDLQTSRLAAVQGARQLFLGVKTAAAQVDAYEQASVSAQKSLDASQRGKEVGYRTQVDVLNALQLLYQARRSQAAARYSAILELLQLKAVVGALTERDLEGLTVR